MTALFQKILDYDYLICKNPEQEDQLYKEQEELVEMVESLGLRDQFDQYVEQHQEIIY